MTTPNLDESTSEKVSDENQPAAAPALKLWHALVAIVTAFVIYCVIIPLFDDLHRLKFHAVHYHTSVIERFVEAVVACWFFVLGACIGSFLNVIVYRLPHRLPITGSSFCPRCSKTIAWYDNIPILSWLRLQATCRHCRLPISSQYPTVELAIGLTFFALAILGIGMAGQNLPMIRPGRAGFGFNLTSAEPPLTLIYICQCLCIVTLAANGLMVHAARHSSHTRGLPLTPTAFALFSIAVIRLSFPATDLLATADSFGATFVQMLSGLTLGLAAGCTYWLAFTMYPAQNDCKSQVIEGCRMGIVMSFGLVGVTFGWQAVAQFAVVLSGVHVLSALRKIVPCCQPTNPLGQIAITAVLFALGWRWLPQPEFVGFSHVVLTLSLAAAAGVIGALGQGNGPTVHRVEQLDRV